MKPTGVIAATGWLALLASAPATGQSYIGITAGPTLATMSGSFIDQADGVEWGVEIAMRFETRLFGHTYMRTGVGFTQKGGSKLTLSNSGTDTYGYKTAYLRIPLVIRQEIPLGNGPWAIGPYAGLAFGSNSGCSLKPGDAFEFPYTCADTMPGGDVESLEFSVPVGADVWIHFRGASRFVLGAQLDFGLTNVLQEAADLGQSARQNVFTAYFGFMLPLFVESP